jgi:hypothetical protein
MDNQLYDTFQILDEMGIFQEWQPYLFQHSNSEQADNKTFGDQGVLTLFCKKLVEKLKENTTVLSCCEPSFSAGGECSAL